MPGKISLLKKRIIFSCVVAAAASFAFSDDLFQLSKNLDIFASVYKTLNINYVDDINSTKLMRTGIDAMLEDLDPYTEYVPESDIEDYRMKYVSTHYGGIGASILSRDGKVIISEPYQGFPAQKADVRAGDELLQINGVTLKDKTSEEVSNLLKGSRGTPLKLLINRPGETTPITKNIVREEITQPNVPYYGMLANNIGYIKLDKFLENSAQEVKDALTELKKNNLNGLVLDLRYNGGGILQEAVKIINLFVPKDVLVVTQKGRNAEKSISYKTFAEPLEPNLPLTVLVNNRSASASEILAGSLQDLDRAVIIGQRSFGKGLVQQTFNLPYNTLVKVTIAKYYTPSGRCIQALDYTHRNPDGDVEKVADSLISEYKTSDGRSVYDGSGIYPDIYVKPRMLSPIAQTLITRYLIFDYATSFRNAHTGIAPAKTFRLSDADYANFVNYLSNKDYNYSTRTEKLLTDLQTEATKEHKLEDIKSEFEALKHKVFYSKKNDLTQFKPEIKQLLENEIVSRYYFQKGRMENSFANDTELKTATDILTDKTRLAAILKGEGAYKTIGKPGEAITASTGGGD
ncbi:S41 family peptidase (plasmid) [Pedobacter sp. BS3]|uniref:S41 family peptidase n=1 Tax=Pedobacter sp. BS3 TaxID=2567937 RepID=UPI0011ED406D|nr:S41 family peptidase [Pedobacter sp. BS3]TZF86036.1 S41 family peptidase [Pedobacter sp. BS3]